MNVEKLFEKATLDAERDGDDVIVKVRISREGATLAPTMALAICELEGVNAEMKAVIVGIADKILKAALSDKPGVGNG